MFTDQVYIVIQSNGGGECNARGWFVNWRANVRGGECPGGDCLTFDQLDPNKYLDAEYFLWPLAVSDFTNSAVQSELSSV